MPPLSTLSRNNSTLCASGTSRNAINLWHPEWQPIFDADPEQAALTRQRILEKISSDRSLMFAYHFPWPGLGHIRKRPEGGFAWEPEPWQFSA
ncbi:hypothetical protein NUACC21_77920 [Scytonema sp. NUACC21]